MTTTTVFFAGLFYVATAFLVLGLARKIIQYAKAPAPLKIPTTPAPTTKAGVVMRMGREVVLFESLFKSNKWIWIFGWLFHVGLAVVLFRHLRYFQEPVWSIVSLQLVQAAGKYASFAMVAGLIGLWARRFLVDRVRYISTPSDHLILVLLIGIGLTGMGMTFVAHTDIVSLKMFMLGLMRFEINPLPQDPILMAHLAMVATLMIIFPISKLLHAPGVFFSPSRNQVDDPREHRHVAPWAAELEK
jgi:nitrate reductase gamma subunit